MNKKAVLLVFTGILLLGFGGMRVSASGTRGREPKFTHAIEGMEIPNIEAVELDPGDRLFVIASTSIVGDVVANIGGDAIDLKVLIGIGQDPHSYEPTPRALTCLEHGHVIFVNGQHLEEGLMEVIEDISKVPIVPVSAGIEPLESGDPHFWTDPTNVMVWVENIEDVLSKADPRNHKVYERNATVYRAKLRELDDRIRQLVARIPERDRKLVTDHHMIRYFADEYGLEVMGALLPSTSTNAEASAGETAKLVELLRKEGITSFFVGSTAGRGLQRLADAITREAGSEVRMLTLLTGSLAPRGRRGDTYLGYIEFNVAQIVKGLSR